MHYFLAGAAVITQPPSWMMQQPHQYSLLGDAAALAEDTLYSSFMADPKDTPLIQKQRCHFLGGSHIYSYSTKYPVTKQVPRDVHAQCCK